MKKIILVLTVLLTFSVNVFADTYCYSTGNPNSCFQAQINSIMSGQRKLLKEIYSSPKLSQSEKRSIEADQRDWENRVNSQCPNSECVGNAARDRVYSIAAIVVKVRGMK